MACDMMLTELHVCNFVLIKEARLKLQPGLTVFSGETGAGKSILVDALSAAFGARADRNWVRHGEDRAEITIVLDGIEERTHSSLQEQGIEAEYSLIFRRVITSDGRSSAYINGNPVPAKSLRDIAHNLLAIHGQHEHQILLKPEFQRCLLDDRIGKDTLETTRNAYRHWRQEREILENLRAQQGKNRDQELWLRGEVQRLAELKLADGLQTRLQNEVESGRHFSQIHEAVVTCLNILEEDDINVRCLLAKSQLALEKTVKFRPDLAESVSLLSQMDGLLSELEPNLRPILEESFDPAIVDEAEERLMHLNEAMQRHQTDEKGLLHIFEDMETRISHLETSVWDIKAQEQRLEAAALAYEAEAKRLSVARNQVAEALCRELRPLMNRLALTGMQLRIEIHCREQESSHWTAGGWDEVEFMASSNPGEPFRALSAIASGGELSRLVLALKGCAALTFTPGIAVFDEVDAGIGGETAWCVGELLAAMSRERQVLVVSHLPQVAACANHQIRIQKRQKAGRTITTFKNVEKSDRCVELARMLGGSNPESLKHAAHMLERGGDLEISAFQ